ncbi:MAG: response regulator transcription factor [Bacteroidales bacterium]|nr:response regulator transcription factor [Bacteroidales bacterium]
MGKLKGNILLVEDDENLGFVLKDYLEMTGYFVDLRVDGVSGLDAFNNNPYDLCILDIMLPLKDGFTIAKEIRKKDEKIPIIFLTAKNLEEDKINGFKLGGDDYITKPFSTEELNMRISAILRRAQTSLAKNDSAEVFQLGIYTFDYPNQVLISPDSERRLTNKEAEVLRLLCIYKNKILRRDIALKQIWGDDDYFMGRSMDVYIAKIRKFLQNDNRISINNIHGRGFILEIKTE